MTILYSYYQKYKTVVFNCLVIQVFLGLVLFNGLVFSQGKPDKELINRLDSYYSAVQKDWGIPGMTVGVIQNGQLIFANGYGKKKEGGEDNLNPNSLMAIASNSKAFTSAIIAMLVQDGKIAWDDKVQKYLPYFKLYDPYVSQNTTIKDLLCHRVGLGTFSGDIIWHKSSLNAEEIIKRIQYLPKAFPFRDGFGYSNLMYITAGKLIEVVSGKSWGEVVKERILKPLGMDRTIYLRKDLEAVGNYATPHALMDGKNIPIDYVNWETVAATGGLISSVVDMSKWIIFNINHGIIGEDTLLTPESRNIIWQPHNSFPVDHTKPNEFGKKFSGYGLGWGISDYHGKMRIGHTGGYDGMISAVNFIPDEKIGVVVLTNGMKSPILPVTYYTLDALLGIKEKDWSTEMLKAKEERDRLDTRITERESKRILKTKPSLPLENYTGNYKSDIYGNIVISKKGKDLRLEFEHTPDYNSTLQHWHYDVWKIVWDTPQAWFKFGTVKFNMDNNLKITGMDFDVPNDDIFFEELKPYRED